MVDRRRKWRAQNQDIFIKDICGRDEFLVSGSQGTEYLVNLHKPSCDCPDWYKRKPDGGCKHILHVKIEEGLIKPFPSAKTNFGNPQTRSRSNYSSNWDSLSRLTKKRDNWRCQKCGAKGGPYGTASLAAHHMIPKSKGGKDTQDNLITLCHSCHEKEHGHSIPNSSGCNSLGGSERIQSPTHSVTETSENESMVDSNSQRKSSPSETSLTDSNSKLESSQAKGTRDASHDPTDTIEIRSPKPISSIPKMISQANYDSIYLPGKSLAATFLCGLVLLVITSPLSDTLVRGILVLVATGFAFAFFLSMSKNQEKLVDELSDLNSDLHPLLNEIENARLNHHSISLKTLDEVLELFNEIESRIPPVKHHLNDQYIDWVADSESRIERLNVTEPSKELSKKGSLKDVDQKERKEQRKEQSKTATDEDWTAHISAARSVDRREITERYR